MKLEIESWSPPKHIQGGDVIAGALQATKPEKHYRLFLVNAHGVRVVVHPWTKDDRILSEWKKFMEGADDAVLPPHRKRTRRR